MSELFTRSLGGKAIVGTDGTDVGTLRTITMDPESGALHDLVVDPDDRSSSTVTDRSDDDRLQIPVSRIETVNDRIVVRADDDRSH